MIIPLAYVQTDFASRDETITQYRLRTRPEPAKHRATRLRKLLDALGRHLADPQTRQYL